jgi:hypothetical protein
VTNAVRAPRAPQLDDDAKKGHYGVTYLDAVVTAAGFDLHEPRPGADMLAYDGLVTFPEGSVRVQIKTTHIWDLAGTNERMGYTATEKWVESWSDALMPVYFVVVVVPHSTTGGPWLDHHATGTHLPGTAAFWSRIDTQSFTPQNMSVAALRSQRLDGSTLLTWQLDLIKAFGG